MKFKKSVSIKKFSNPAAMKILQVVQDTAPVGYEPTVTSGQDGKHMKGSKHNSGQAFDIRTRDYPGFNLYFNYRATRYLIWEWIKRMRINGLNKSEYDIIFDIPKHRNHIHIEFDPDKNNYKGYYKD